MGYKLCTAEKPSVARDIARVVGANNKMDGYFEGAGYLVTWAVGHLVKLAEPEAYGYLPQSEIYGEKREQAYAELPLLPTDWKLEVIENSKRQFEIVKSLMHRADVDYIIDCGDMGAEGHILQWLIRQKAGCTKPVKRFCATSMTDEAIKAAMSNLREEKEFIPIIRGELCKKKADWMLGLSLSRAESLKYKTSIRVGRVQSPTLAFVISRYSEVKNFKVTNYYTITAKVCAGGATFNVFWKADKDGLIAPDKKDGSGRCLDRAVVARCADSIVGDGHGRVIKVSSAKRGTDRPQLYDITELQRDANRRYGYSAAITLVAAQALYETQKVLTYPRTDSRYITSDLEGYMPERVQAIGTIGKYKGTAEGLLRDGLKIDKKIVDDTKVTDHHAIIPTPKIRGFDPATMKPTEAEKGKGLTAEIMRNVLDLVLTRVLVAFSKPFTYEQTEVAIQTAGGFVFNAVGKKPINLGWKATQERLGGAEDAETPAHGAQEDEPEQRFPALTEGQQVTISSCEVVAKKTTPPKLHTEATLLTEMENAGQKIEGGAILKGKGIGTQATRAEIIKGLFDSGVVETVQKGKIPYIQPTEKGLAVMRVLPPELYSAKITADWETKIAMIADGQLSEQKFLDEFVEFLRQKVTEVKNMEAVEITFLRNREVFALCPWCKSPVYKWIDKDEKGKPLRTRYYCSGENDKSCGFSFSNDNPLFVGRLQQKLGAPQAKKLIEKGSFTTSQCKRKADGKTYSGKFAFVQKEGKSKSGETKKYVSLTFELV